MIRRICVPAGLLALFLQGSSGGHMLLVEHTRCVEHAALVHDGEAHHHVAAEHTRVDSAAVHGTPDLGSDETHEHCALSIDRRDALVSVAALLVSTQSVDASRDLAFTDAFVAPRTARFRIAPKNSPPA